MRYLLFLLMLPLTVLTAGKITYKVETNKPALTYRCGEAIYFKVTVLEDGKTVGGIPFEWELFTENAKTQKGAGKTDPEHPLVVGTALGKPGFAYLQLHLKPDSGKHISGQKSLSVSAGADVAEIKQDVPEPQDYDAFWKKQKSRLAEVPVTAKLTPVKSSYANVDCWMFEIPAAGDYPVTGFLSIPKNAPGESLPGHMVFHGYGFNAVPKNDNMAAQGFISMSVSQFGLPQDRMPEYYVQQGKGAFKSFAFRNNQTPEKSDFLPMILRSLRAAEYLKSRPEWNKKELIVSGGSMGAFQAVHVAAHEPAVTLADLSIPWCANLGGVTKGRFNGWRPGYVPALNYFDIVNAAKRIKCPANIYIALGDTVCPASGLFAMYNSMNCKRNLTAKQSATHGYRGEPDSVQYKMSSPEK